MLLALANETDVEFGFLEACVEVSDFAVPVISSISPSTSATSDDSVVSSTSLPPSPTSTLVSRETLTTPKIITVVDSEHKSYLLASYKAALTDFYGYETPCVYKTGPAWPVAQGQSQNLVRAARPIHEHGIVSIWLQILWTIVACLDSLKVPLKWNTIDPLAYGNAGQAELFCDFVVVISVNPGSLAFEVAKATAEAVHGIIAATGFPEIQVAIIESVYRRRQGKLMGFSPTYELQSLSGLRKPFTPTLGLSIAPHKTPYYEGTGSVFLRLSSDKSDKRIALLTCAHVAHPPPKFENKTYIHKFQSQPREDIILLGSGSFDHSVGAIMKFIGDQAKAIASWETPLSKIPLATDNEAPGITARRNELTALIAVAKDNIRAANDLHTKVTKNYAFTNTRVLGSVLHCAKIEVGAGGFMCDWALIQIDVNKLEEQEFQGNKLFVGGNKTAVDWENYMFSQPHDRRDFHVPDDLLLQLQDYVREEEFRKPQNFDIHNVKTLLAIKNGCATGTTFGRVNGLESVTREYPDHGLSVEALEFIVCGYDTKLGENSPFSADGDSGSIVVDRLGRLIGLLTGGSGPTITTDKTYITPFYALKTEIVKKFKDAYLLPASGV
jgi:hypothetical protein